MGQIEIEKDVPIPPTRSRKYPWKEMELGDSFYVGKPAREFYPQASIAGTRYGLKFTVREEGGGCRVWRVK